MRRLIDITRWPTALIFLVGGALAIFFAFVTVNLFTLAMANLGFLQRHGLLAVMEGALVQTAGLAAWGILALAAYLGFKICESELVRRYFRWTGKGKDG